MIDRRKKKQINVRAKSVGQQRRSAKELRNWKDYMEFEKVVLVEMVLISILKKSLSRILRLKQKNPNPILQHKWVSQLTLFKTISFLQT